jgi:NADH dehydrogenase
MILVVGATGALGSEICRQLVAEGKTVRAIIRPVSDPVRVAELKKLGIETVEADLKDTASITKACVGVASVISTASACPTPHQSADTIPAVDQTGQLHLVNAARQAGVSHFVYVSFSGNINIDSPLATAKRAVELQLSKSGMGYTILRPSFFMEVWISPALGFDFANAKAQVYGEGHNKISWISLVDVAHFAVAALRTPAMRNATFELGGPEALSPLEVIHLYEQAEHRPFTVQHVPEATLEKQRAEATDPLQKTFPALMLAYAHGDNIDMTSLLRQFPRKLISVRDYIQHTMPTP